MAGGAVTSSGGVEATRVEAPVTFKTYLMCAFAAFGGIFFGFDSGYINGVLNMKQFIIEFDHLNPNTTPKASFVVPSSQKSLIVSILSCGTFFGALIAGDMADWIGRRTTVVCGCGIFLVGVILQIATTTVGVLVAGRLIAGLGVGFVSAIIILYMSEIAPRKVRGAIVSGYQFCITIGLMLASCVDFATQGRTDSGAFRIPIGIQMLWALILGGGLLLLPESPRWYIRKGRKDKARAALARVRDQPADSEFVEQELLEIEANFAYEQSLIPDTGYFGSWLNCFKGNIFHPNSNVRRTVLGTSLQMMQQWTGVNFVFYFGTTFFQALHTAQSPFLLSMITTIVNVLSTPISFITMEKIGRRPLLLWGALGMVICQFLVAIIGVSVPGAQTGGAPSATSAMIAFICIYIFFFASTWGPGAWVVIGEIFPLPIRARGVGLSTASNWLWNCIIAVITPYMVDPSMGNLGAKVFFVWGSLCACAFVYTYFLIPETKGLSLEQVDKMMEETTPRTSSKWTPHSTFAVDMGMEHEKELTGPTATQAEV